MFKREYVFYGKHADYVKALTSKIVDEQNITIFERNVDVLLIAPIIGFVYGKRVEVDKSASNTTKIFAEVMIKESNNLAYNYEVIMLLHQRENTDIDERLDSAFRYVTKDETFQKKCKSIYNSYVLGGVEVLYDKIIKDGETADDYTNNLYEFIEEFNMKYNPKNDLNNQNDLKEITKLFK